MQQHFFRDQHDESLAAPVGPPIAQSFVLRDTLAAYFRHRRLITICFAGILLASLAAAYVLPTYEAEMKIILKNGRVDPLVSAQPVSPSLQTHDNVSEADVNSEVELLKSGDLLREVVLVLGAHKKPSRFSLSHLYLTPVRAEQRRIAGALGMLKRNLRVESLKKSRVITVSYQSSDPEHAAKVLDTLSTLYLKKHMAVHRAPGQLAFFEQEVLRYRNQLEDAERELAEFGRGQGGVAPAIQRENVLQSLAQFETEIQQTKASIAETRNRIVVLQQQLKAAKPRIVTQVRSADNPQLLQQLKSTLLELDLRRTELLTKFTPEYRLVKEVEEKVRQTREAIAAAERKPLRDQTTDVDPTYEWIRGELAKAKSELRALEARASSARLSTAEFRKQALDLNETDVAQRELLRRAKSAEEDYLLYQRKREEARITEAMDEKGIANVAIAEAPLVPQHRSTSPLMYLAAGLLLAVFVSSALVFAAEYFDDTFHTPRQVHSVLQIPVLAAIPATTSESPHASGTVAHS